MTDTVRHLDPSIDSDTLGTTNRSVRFPTTLAEQVQSYADELDRSFSWAVRKGVILLLERELARRETLPERTHPDETPLVAIDGPWDTGRPRYRLVVEGYPVPFIEVCKVMESEAGFVVATDVQERALGSDMPDGPDVRYVLLLDDRYQTGELTWDELWKTAWFWSNAMAIAAGFTSHGPNSRPRNPHGTNEYAAGVQSGWQVMSESGSLGSEYGIDVHFTLPAMADGDQWAHAMRDAIVRTVHDRGGRDIAASVVAFGALEQDRRMVQGGTDHTECCGDPTWPAGTCKNAADDFTLASGPRPIIDTDALDQS